MQKYWKFLAVLAVVLFSNIKCVNASELIKTPIDNVWYVRKGGSEGYFSAKFFEYTIDGNTTYCIEPGTHITTLDYKEMGNLTTSPYSDEINQRMQLIGYYGYDYPTHKTLKYRMATQALIWELTGDGKVEYWTEASGYGDFIDISTERKEINDLIDNHYNMPSFAGSEVTATVGKEYSLVDRKNILSNYSVEENSDVIASIEGNTLKVTPKTVGTINLTLRKKHYTDKLTTLYAGIDDVSQKMGYFGFNEEIFINITIKSLGGKVTVEKLDKDNLSITPKGDATLKGAIYGIYDSDNNKITEVTIGSNSKVTSPNLPKLGRYYLKEIKPSKGYTLDNQKYYFEITEDNLNPSVKVYEKVIEKKIEFYKVINNGKTGILTSEPNVTFEFYLKSSNKLVATKTTDKDGHISLTLPFGTYIVKQTSTTEGFEKIKDFEIVVENDEPLTKVISDGEVMARLKLVKIDSNSKKVLMKDGIKFKIKNLDTNKYVCQNVTYPKAEKICEFETTDGMFITPYLLEAGNYQIEEVENQLIPGYLWNKTPLLFSINDNSDFIYDDELGVILEVRFENKEVMGEVNIHKVGEKVSLEDNTFHYEDIDLDGVIYELYASDDIHSGDGTLIYKKDTLIDSYTTKDGYINIKNLYLGKYYLVESKTLDGYILDKTKHYFELKYQDQYTDIVSLSFTFKNYLPKGTFEFNKSDISTGEVLPNTKIQVYTYEDDYENGTLIFEGYTDADGNIKIPNLFVGKFYFVECEAPEGYVLNDSKNFFEITEDGEVIKANMTNERIVLSVPKTLDNKNTIVNIIGIINIIISLGLYLYAKKENN